MKTAIKLTLVIAVFTALAFLPKECDPQSEAAESEYIIRS